MPGGRIPGLESFSLYSRGASKSKNTPRVSKERHNITQDGAVRFLSIATFKKGARTRDWGVGAQQSVRRIMAQNQRSAADWARRAPGGFCSRYPRFRSKNCLSGVVQSGLGCIVLMMDAALRTNRRAQYCSALPLPQRTTPEIQTGGGTGFWRFVAVAHRLYLAAIKVSLCFLLSCHLFPFCA